MMYIILLETYFGYWIGDAYMTEGILFSFVVTITLLIPAILGYMIGK